MAVIGPLLAGAASAASAIGTAGASVLGTVGSAAASAAPYIGAAGSLASGALGYAGAQAQAKGEQRIAKYNEREIKRAAAEERAAGLRQAHIRQREADLAASRVRAVGAAGGAGTPANILGAVIAQGKENVAMEGYNAQSRYNKGMADAALTRASGKVAAANTRARGTTDLIGSVFSAYDKYKKYG